MQPATTATSADAPPVASAPGPVTRDRVHPAIAIGVIVAILVGGIGGYLLLRPSHSKTTVAADASSSAASLMTDEQVMDAIAWTVDDAPSGWSTSPYDPAVAPIADLSVPSCNGEGQAAVAHRDAVMITNGDYLAVASVDLQQTTENVVADFNTISNGLIVDCLREEVASALAPVLLCSCTGINVNVVPIPPPQNAPSTTYAFRFTVDRFGNVGAQIDAYFIANGRAEVTLLFMSKGSIFPTDTASHLLNKTIKRLWDTPTTNKTF